MEEWICMRLCSRRLSLEEMPSMSWSITIFKNGLEYERRILPGFSNEAVWVLSLNRPHERSASSKLLFRQLNKLCMSTGDGGLPGFFYGECTWDMPPVRLYFSVS